MDILNSAGFPFTEILIGVLLVVVLWKFATRVKLPPGPLGLPIVGYLPFLRKDQHSQLQELGKKYGEMFSLRLGSCDAIVLNSAKYIKDILSRPEVTGRPKTSLFDVLNINSPFFENGDQWLEHRRFSLHVLRDLGLGKSAMNEHIADEIDHFLKEVEKHDSKPCDVVVLLTPSMSNNIVSLIFGKRHEYDDPERMFMDETLNKVTRFFSLVSFIMFFPWVTKLPLVKRMMKVDEFMETAKSFKNFVEKKIAEHKTSLDEANPRDFIDNYLLEIEAKRKKGEKTSLSGNFLIGSVTNFFGAGSETVRTTISWALYTMAAFPDVQKRVQDELDRVIGKGRSPTFSDAKNVPYTQSVLTEVQRWRTVVPISILRRVVRDFKVDDYTIPRDTLVISNLWAAHHNPEDWQCPEEFQPERFLSPDGKRFIKPENFIPFSYGKRSCPGEGMATVEVFLYFTSVLQRFKIELPKNTKPCFDGELGITYHPKPFKLCMVPR